ncbi:MAG TPA: hydroxyacid dehydrogenase [Bdellovibrionales bacterium]|nr:hydroxyacid dehydrogenase [Bdellovibrionales bacterium]
MSLRVLIADRFSAPALLKLKTTPDIEVTHTLEPTPEELRAAEALVVRVRTKIDKAFLDRAPNLKFLVTATSGFDHIDVEEAHARGIQVCFAPEGNVHSAAELTWGLVIAAARKLPQAVRMLERGEWDRERVRGHELYGKTYGIIGLGRIGSRVSAMARAFGMQVLAFDPYVSQERFTELGCERLGMKELLRSADFLSLHVPLTPETHHFINSKTLELMSDHAWLINTSRGPVISEQELAIALDEGWIAGCALDVYEQEPLSVKSALRKRDNVVLSPHCGGNTHEAFERSSQAAADKVIAFAAGQKASGFVLDEAWYAAQRLNQGFRLSLD